MSVLGILGGIASAAGSIGSLFGKKSSGNAVDKASGVASALGGLGSMFGSQQDQQQLYQQQLLYNSPKEQMARLKEAGLNPNLIYGSQGVTGMSANDATAPNLEQYKENPVLKMTPQQIQDMAIQRQHQENENRSVQSNVSLNTEKEKTEQAKQRNLEQNTHLQAVETTAKENYNSIWDIVADDYEAKRDLAKLAVDAQRIENGILKNKLDMSAQELKEQLESYPARMDTILVKLDNLRKEGKHIDAQTAREYASIALMQVQGNYYAAMAGYADENTRRLFIENDFNEQTAPMRFEQCRTALMQSILDTNGKVLDNALGKGEIGSLGRLGVTIVQRAKSGTPGLVRSLNALDKAAGGYQYQQHYYKK